MTVRILKGDCRELLATLPAESVHCVVTSPPYFGLRDYGVPGQIGLEPTPEAFVAEMVSVFRDVRRVLRRDGTIWLNLGDSYSAGNGNKTNHPQTNITTVNGVPVRMDRGATPSDARANLSRSFDGMPKPKDLLGIPWRVAFALQADGWYLRQDIIWSKPNPMPESVRDRCTKAHEYIFLLSKSERYHFDQEPIREEIKPLSGINMRASKHDGGRGHKVRDPNQDVTTKTYDEVKGANRRSVWEVPTQPFPEAHFATFPPALIEPCILAGCPENVCSRCGAPRVRRTKPGEITASGGKGARYHAARLDGSYKAGTADDGMTARARITIGFFASCSCNAGTIGGGTVLDPFGGAGTTGLVADRLGRNAILIELNPEYAAMAERRILGDAGMFAEIAL